MIELEERLRSGLAGLAGEVPVSRNGWAEQERRLAMAGPARRRPMLAAAAAAVVVAATVPATVVTQPAPPPPAGPSPTVGGDQPPEPTIADGPVEVREFTDRGRRWTVRAYLQRGTGEHLACLVAVPTGEPADSPVRHPDSAGCAAVRPGDPPGNKLGALTALGGPTPGGGQLHGLMLFVTAPALSTLDVFAADGAPVTVRDLGRTDDLAMFLADFGPSYDGFSIRVRGMSTAVVEARIR